MINFNTKRVASGTRLFLFCIFNDIMPISPETLILSKIELVFLGKDEVGGSNPPISFKPCNRFKKTDL